MSGCEILFGGMFFKKCEGNLNKTWQKDMLLLTFIYLILQIVVRKLLLCDPISKAQIWSGL